MNIDTVIKFFAYICIFQNCALRNTAEKYFTLIPSHQLRLF